MATSSFAKCAAFAGACPAMYHSTKIRLATDISRTRNREASSRSKDKEPKNANRSSRPNVTIRKRALHWKPRAHGPSCRAKIVKAGACDHMTCRSNESKMDDVPKANLTGKIGKCYHEFCWQRSAPYGGPSGIEKIRNCAHKETCPYAPTRLPNHVPPPGNDLDNDEDYYSD
jgi:hypothetical protein